ncbi:unnamed protein product [Closterium sp. NIES-53]
MTLGERDGAGDGHAQAMLQLSQVLALETATQLSLNTLQLSKVGGEQNHVIDIHKDVEGGRGGAEEEAGVGAGVTSLVDERLPWQLLDAKHPLPFTMYVEAGGRGTSAKEELAIKASSSLMMAASQRGASGQAIASSYVVGKKMEGAEKKAKMGVPERLNVMGRSEALQRWRSTNSSWESSEREVWKAGMAAGAAAGAATSAAAGAGAGATSGAASGAGARAAAGPAAGAAAGAVADVAAGAATGEGEEAEGAAAGGG